MNIDDLLASLASQSSALRSLKTSAKGSGFIVFKCENLVSTSSSEDSGTIGSVRQTYDQTKKEVDTNMKHIREVSLFFFVLLLGYISVLSISGGTFELPTASSIRVAFLT